MLLRDTNYWLFAALFIDDINVSELWKMHFSSSPHVDRNRPKADGMMAMMINSRMANRIFIECMQSKHIQHCVRIPNVRSSNVYPSIVQQFFSNFIADQNGIEFESAYFHFSRVPTMNNELRIGIAPHHVVFIGLFPKNWIFYDYLTIWLSPISLVFFRFELSIHIFSPFTTRNTVH